MSKRKKNVGAILHSRGATFRVWAPFASSVSVKGSFSQELVPLKTEGDGYWSVQVKGAEAGHEYQFIIENAGKSYERNDPRAMQLTSSGGVSIVTDPSFDWEGDNFKLPPKNEQIIYEMHIGSFKRPDASTEGTFEEAVNKLGHLADLGINVIELMPVSTMFHDHGWGYAPDYMFAVESAYGGRHGLLNFVKTAHSKGIGVILDVVYNHLFPSKNLDLWRFDGWYENNGGGIYFYNDWRGETPWGARPDFGRSEVRQYILDNVRHWLHDCHIDGLRVDSTLYMRNVYGRHDDPATDLPEAWSLMQKINAISHKIKPVALMVGEDIAANDYITKPADEGGAGFDTQWQVTMPHAFRQAILPNITDETQLADLVGELGRTYNGDSLQQVIYFDSHDSAANGASRINEEADPGHPQSAKALSKLLIASGILMSAPGIPMMLQGQEFAQGQNFSDWHGLDWDLAEKYSGVVTANKHLINLRKNVHGNSAGLRGQDINISHVDDDNKVLAYHRWDKGGPADDIMVVVNFANNHHKEYVLGFPLNGDWHVRFNSTWHGYSPQFKEVNVPDIKVNSGQGTLVLPPRSLLILSQDT